MIFCWNRLLFIMILQVFYLFRQELILSFQLVIFILLTFEHFTLIFKTFDTLFNCLCARTMHIHGHINLQLENLRVMIIFSSPISILITYSISYTGQYRDIYDKNEIIYELIMDGEMEDSAALCMNLLVLT